MLETANEIANMQLTPYGFRRVNEAPSSTVPGRVVETGTARLQLAGAWSKDEEGMEAMTIVAAHSVSHFFLEAVEDAKRARGVDATDGATRYLVGVLADFAHPDHRAGEALERPLTLLLDEALHSPDPADRFQRLRIIGDGVLYGCGFFGDHFEARGVDARYLHGLGTRAYGAASSMLRQGANEPGPDLFGELAEKFEALVEVVGEVADTTIAMGTESSSGLLRVYERWLKTGSERLASALTSRGVMPTRGSRGVIQ